MTTSRWDRRSVLRAAAGLAVGGSVAGCSEALEALDEQTPTPSTTSDPLHSESLPSAEDPDVFATATAGQPTTDDLDVGSIATTTDEDPDVGSILSDTDPEPDLGHLEGIGGSTYPPDLDGFHRRRFEWEAVGSEWVFELDLKKAHVSYYQDRFGRGDDFARYVVDPYDDATIQGIASEFESFRDRYDLTEWEVVNVTKSFIQSMQYTNDNVYAGVNQYAQYPVETLFERGGDCEDTAILLAALLREMGYDCVLLGLWNTEPAHMAVGARGDSSIDGTYYEDDGRRYYYVETTGEGWDIGEMPDYDGSTEADLMHIGSYPTIVYDYRTTVRGSAVHVDCTVTNYGDATTTEFTELVVEFQNEMEFTEASGSVALDSLAPGETTRETVVVEPPQDSSLRLSTSVQTVSDTLDTHHSEWRRPR